MRERLREVAEQAARRRGSYSSASRPTSLRRREQRSKSAAPRRAAPAARACRPARTCRAGTRPRPAAGRRRAGVGRVAVHEAVASRAARWISLDRADMRGSSAAGSRPAASSAGWRRASRAVVLHERVQARRRSPSRRPRRGSRRGSRASARPGPRGRTLDGLDRAVERHPGHHLRVREVPARAAHLPDAFVRLASRPSRDTRISAAECASASSSAAGRARRARCSASMTSP